jgi:PTS system mannose-specific IIA component
VEVIVVEPDTDLLRRELRGGLEVLDRGDGVSILTEPVGGTPSNVSRSASDGQRVCMIAGVNLPMLVRLLNYAGISTAELAGSAVGGGRGGIFASNAARND